jgi:hypothetical protein
LKVLTAIVAIIFAMALLFGCGGGGGGGTPTSTTTTGTTAIAPAANAGRTQSVIVNSLVTVDGSGSTAAIGATLTYSWSLSSKPAGSNAVLSNATAVNPAFTPDVAGTYVLSLVVNDGTTSSSAATVSVTASAGNAAPVANAGRAQSVVVNALVTLAGSASSDANGDPLTYSWSMTTKPVGSSASLSSSTAVRPTFTPDVAGIYVISLVVNDGTVNSAPAAVTVTAATGNAAPVANAGPAQSVVVNTRVTLDGSASSDANGDSLTYSWSMTAKPVGSGASLSSSSAVRPTFTPDVAGAYVILLVVNDGTVNSAVSTVVITATAGTTVPVTTASPLGGHYTAPVLVMLTANEPATIYYTTNGVDPTIGSPSGASPVSGISIPASAILKFFAIDSAGSRETVKSETYTIP